MDSNYNTNECLFLYVAANKSNASFSTVNQGFMKIYANPIVQEDVDYAELDEVYDDAKLAIDEGHDMLEEMHRTNNDMYHYEVSPGECIMDDETGHKKREHKEQKRGSKKKSLVIQDHM